MEDGRGCYYNSKYSYNITLKNIFYNIGTISLVYEYLVRTFGTLYTYEYTSTCVLLYIIHSFITNHTNQY